jgi:2-amino-4-hydroxy-6-hydroxymethyldihydropteridine diphosphokinase
METAYLLLGSNLGDREANLKKAVARIGTVSTLLSESAIYITKAWGKTDQPDFLNQAIGIKTTDSPLELLREILAIELALGRARQEHWGPRLIDIDILLFGAQIVKHPRLQIPHPELSNRRFALMPLAEIAASVVHPQTKRSINEHLAMCPDPLSVTPWTSKST